MDHVDEIAGLRSKIDEIDSRLICLLANRFQLCLRVGSLKEQADMPVMQPNRVAEVTARVALEATTLGVSPEFAGSLWQAIILEACRLEDLRKAARKHRVSEPEGDQAWRGDCGGVCRDTVASMASEAAREDGRSGASVADKADSSR